MISIKHGLQSLNFLTQGPKFEMYYLLGSRQKTDEHSAVDNSLISGPTTHIVLETLAYSITHFKNYANVKCRLKWKKIYITPPKVKKSTRFIAVPVLLPTDVKTISQLLIINSNVHHV